MKKVLFGLMALALVVVLVLVGIGAYRYFTAPKKAESPKAETEEYRFRPMLITTACIAAIEKPTATKVLMSDAAAEEYRAFLEAFGFLCVSNAEAKAETKFDVVFAADAAQHRRLSDLLDRTGESGVLALAFDVRDLKTSDFRCLLETFPCAAAHLWMPGDDTWLLVGRRTARPLKLDAMMDVFVRDRAFDILAEAKATALSDVFASYVGRREDVMDAFRSGDLSAVVKPEFFVTKEIPATDWIVRGDVDEDIFRQTMAEIRSMQVIRRLVLEGNMLSEHGEADAAVDAWSRAMKRNPRDPMLLARLDRLSRNAGALQRIGNVNGAAHLYEAMVLINPTDPTTVFNYGTCLLRLGKKEQAKAVFARAAELRKARKAE